MRNKRKLRLPRLPLPAGRTPLKTLPAAHRQVKLLKLILVSLLVLGLSVVFAFELAYWQKIFPGISITQVPVGNKTQKEAQTLLGQIIVQEKPQLLELSWDTQSLEISLDELNLIYHPEKTVQKAYDLGRNQGPAEKCQARYQAWTKGKNFGLDYSLKKVLLEEKIATLSSQVFIPAIPPLLKLEKRTNQVLVESGSDGQELEAKKLFAQIDFQLANLIVKPIPLPIKKTVFEVSQQALKKTKARAQLFFTKKLTLRTADQAFELKGEELLPFISFQGGFDEKTIKNYVAQLTSLINQGPQNALFRFENGKAVAFQPSKKGASVNQTKTLQLIKEGLEDLEKSGENEKIIKLPVQLTEPEIKIGDINRFGIAEKISEGHSTFHGSIASRIHNIQLASSKLSGILIPPGEIFSFNQSLGEVSEATGFKQAYIIKEGRTILGDGGGVCQISTTLFRAVIKAGLPILERHPHAYRVSYYEQDSQPGFDATVFEPTADLKFRNDTPAYLLIQANINTKTKTLVFEIYGTDDERLVSTSKPRIWDQVPPPPDLYQDDPTLPAGTVKQIDWKAWGAKVAFDWEVTRNGEVLQERTFYSHYQPWQAIYLRGTAP